MFTESIVHLFCNFLVIQFKVNQDFGSSQRIVANVSNDTICMSESVFLVPREPYNNQIGFQKCVFEKLFYLLFTELWILS